MLEMMPRENLVLELTALSGDMPTGLLSSFPGTYEWTMKSVRKLREEKTHPGI